ncbi:MULTISPECIES: TRAP transporter substrate-binding protein [Leeia]|uniref:TRAP transporter substrate-binding protein n=1 Tax=Leeia aquatica TaxID=2725557 RepID=A0A847S4X9_9NEIS|nr:TRAP transporter substrate-binding protein [Leeia aquatica]NLR73835.1 TRAP transporter substrate-binding protein [Leeia aquatica]
MERRSFLKKAGVGVAAAGVGSAAVAADGPSIKWRLASSFPKGLDTIYGGAETLAARVKQLTGGKFEIRCFASGEIAPGNQVLDVVQQGTVECGHTCSYYYLGKNKAFAFDTAIPFGLTARQQNAWMYFGNGLSLMRELFKEYNIINFPGGNTGVQMGGWFRSELKGLDSLKGLKMRIPGLGGEIMGRLGAVPQAIPGSDIYPALEKGTIDAAEWVGPYDDEKLGFYKVAKNYYYPGWWEPGPQVSFYVNINEWNKLPKDYQAAFEAAAAEANVLMMAEYDAKNPQALVRLIQNDVKVRAYPHDILSAAQKEAFQLYEEEAAKNPKFKKIYDDWKKFRTLQHGWFRLAEGTMEDVMYSSKK